MMLAALAGMLVAFTASLLLTGIWVNRIEKIAIRKDQNKREAGEKSFTWEQWFVAEDMNKSRPGRPVQAVRAAGVWAVISIAFGLLSYMALYAFYRGGYEWQAEYMALTLLLSLSAFLGFMDDLLGWMTGLRRIYRVVLMLPIALPFVVIKAGTSRMDIPFIGVVDLGKWYPFFLVPIGIMGGANAFNMLAGYNGLEAGMGALLLLGAFAYSIQHGLEHVAIASLISIAALIGFLVYNWYPARAFPGNAFTYGIGAYYAGLVVLGNFEKFGVFIFALYFLEFALFLRSLKDGVEKINFASACEDGSISPRTRKVYSVTHLILKILLRIKGRKECPTGVYEYHVTLLILAIQAALIVAGLAIF